VCPAQPDGVANVTVSVVVPTLRRPQSLARCLDALAAQASTPAEVIVVRRADDNASSDLIAQHPGVRSVVVHRPGVVAAMARGTAAANGEVVAFCDDDAAPRSDWIRRIQAAFVDPGIGGFGGRDVLAPPHPEYPPTEIVGVLGSWGRMTGDHHRGAGAPRDVDVLKAVNMAFRVGALAFPEGLRGSGAQVHFELPICLRARARGWRLRYDPELVVDHDPEQRFDADRRDRPDDSAVRDAAYNFTLSLLVYRPELTLRRLVYGLAVGDRGSPGAVRAAVAIARRDRETFRRLGPSLRGQLDGYRAARRPGALTLHSVRAAEDGGAWPASL